MLPEDIAKLLPKNRLLSEVGSESRGFELQWDWRCTPALLTLAAASSGIVLARDDMRVFSD